MNFLGLQITRASKALAPVPTNGGWFPILRESYSGAWQANVEVDLNSVLSNPVDFACRTLIASDVAKLRLRLVRKDKFGIWAETTNPAYSPVLRKPNHFQHRIQFFESWVLSKLQAGNSYMLKQRDNRGVVTALYVLDPSRVTPLISDSADVFYELRTDHLAKLTARIIVPAREIIHDRFNCFFHPLVGLSPIFAGGVSAVQGLSIQSDSTKFFQNGARPGGILTAPGSIGDDTAARLKAYWDTNFSGANAGKVAVVGDGLKYEPMRATAKDSQLTEQWKETAEAICSVYHVPGFMVGVGEEPSYNNVQNLTLRYYSQCLQKLIEDIEASLDEGLGMDGVTIGVEFDLDDLLRMDTVTQFDVAAKAKGIATLNEQRQRLNLGPMEDAGTIFLQQQDHSLKAIAARDALLIEQAEAGPVQLPPPAPVEPTEPEMTDEDKALFMRAVLRKELGLAA